ncbi:hypothetical protein GLOTRDRAFT_135771 [Gloeophyllum trabeum ATCC 11539]|uniref:DUF3752 domain-containing protein n=1 Tax=Gloeophyllum trabeum (strain ATCC 11539 / FP-39264 / Madison 617) TaxID=670483 RepID=S7QPI8_GLOTA|nr:uncharacterized protein GLOTRDRAFT_135771 [Gloeophyllum trabeum ATCC 11539]EPQ61252.1 hypothetical protein GLOTRDRAFT_135771 [Gloeophyllum trabeum ATCC 11539]
MSSIGPQIPPHLLNQTKPSTSDDDEEAGPQLPPEHASANRSDEQRGQKQEEEESDEDDYVPALPPDLAASRRAGPSLPSLSPPRASPPKRVIGPSFPPPSFQEDDDDDEVGPVPLPAGAGPVEEDGVREFLEREERRRKAAEDAAKPKALQREEWMLVPPSSQGLLGSLDPAKLRQARQFSKSTNVKSTDTTLWTETPAERQQRLADEVSGKKRRIENAEPDVDAEDALRKRRRDEVVRQGVEEYTRKHRGPTLLQQHATSEKSSKDKAGSEEPPVIWDHARDMALGGRLMDDKKRDQIINDSKGLSDRFGAGRTGGFL